MSMARLRRRARQHLCALEVAFPCVICSFIVVVMLLCFCCCPILLYRLRGEIGYNYLALLYFILGLVVFGVVGECLLLARRKGRLPCCPVEEARGPVFSQDRVLTSPKVDPCRVHGLRSTPSGPPPAYDFVSAGKKPPRSPVQLRANHGNGPGLKMLTTSPHKKTAVENLDAKSSTKNQKLNTTTKVPDVKKITNKNPSNETVAKNPDIQTSVNSPNFTTSKNPDTKLTKTMDDATTTMNPDTQTITKDDITNMSENADTRTVDGNSDIETTKDEGTKMTVLQSTGDPTS